MPHLAGTEEDVKKIAKTLGIVYIVLMVKLANETTDIQQRIVLVETQGYQLSNIRVLVNGHRASHVPNKSNIVCYFEFLIVNHVIANVFHD